MKERRTTRKVLALLLIVAMLLTLVPVGAFAADAGQTAPGTPQKIRIENYDADGNEKGGAFNYYYVTEKDENNNSYDFLVYCFNSTLQWPVHNHIPTDPYDTTVGNATKEFYVPDNLYYLSDEVKDKLFRIFYAGYPHNNIGLFDADKKYTPSEAEMDEYVKLPDIVVDYYSEKPSDWVGEWVPVNTLNFTLNNILNSNTPESKFFQYLGWNFEGIEELNRPLNENYPEFINALYVFMFDIADTAPDFIEWWTVFMYGESPEGMFHDATQNAIWRILYENGVANNTKTIVSEMADGSLTKALVDFANGVGPYADAHVPDRGTTIADMESYKTNQFEAGLTLMTADNKVVGTRPIEFFETENGTYESEELHFDKDTAYMMPYKVSLVDGNNVITTLNSYGSEAFKLVTAQVPTDTTNIEFKVAADNYWPSEVYQYVATSEKDIPNNQKNHDNHHQDMSGCYFMQVPLELTLKTVFVPKNQTVVEVMKEWDDNNNVDQLRPASVTVRLYSVANGVETDENQFVVLNAENDWYGMFTGLSKDKVYTVKEDAVENYPNVSVVETMENSFTITNSYTTLTVKKNWDDKDVPAEYLQQYPHPTSVTVELFAIDGTTSTKIGDAVELSESTGWEYTWNGLSDAVEYFVAEKHVSGYKEPVVSSEKNGNNWVYTITNRPDVETITVKKEWDETAADSKYAGIVDSIRPTEVKVELVKKSETNNQDGSTSQNVEIVYSATLSAPEWTASWYVPNDPAAEYKVLEVTDSPYYSESYKEDEDTGTVVITNTLRTQSVSVQKDWVDDGSEHRPVTLTVDLYLETADGAGAKVDTATLTDQAWNHTWENLPHGKYYVVEEALPPSGSCFYQSAVSENSAADSLDQHFVITNTHINHSTPSAIQFTVTKEWKNANGEDINVPAGTTVDVQLYEVTTSGGIGYTPYEPDGRVTLGENGQWSYTWHDLPFAQYFVKELNVAEKYFSNISNDGNPEIVEEWVNGVMKLKSIITNTERNVNVTIKKIWEGNQTPPNDLEVVVYLMAEGTSGELTQQAIVTLTADTWEDTISVPYGNYTVEELLAEDSGYRLKEFDGVQDANGNWTFTLVNEPDTIDIELEKVWVDENDKAGVRPEKIQVELFRFNDDTDELEFVQTVELSSTAWKTTVTGLPHGEYEIVEIPVKDYVTTVKEEITTNKGDLKFTLTNTYTKAETAQLIVTKQVRGTAGDTTALFPMKVELSDVTVNGKYGDMDFTNGKATFSLKDGDSITAMGLPIGVEYKVEETDAKGHTVSYTNEAGVLTVNGATVTVTNTKNKPSGGGGGSYTPSTGSLEISKTVVGETVPSNSAFVFTVRLDKAVNANISGVQFENGVGTFVLRDGETKYLGGLPAGANYTVTEAATPGFEASFIGETGMITVGQTAKVTCTNKVVPVKEEPKDKDKDKQDNPEDRTQEDDVTVPVGGESAGTDKDDEYDLDDPNAPTGGKDAPQTGDTANAMLWVMLFMAVLVGYVRINRPAYKHAKRWF